MPSMSAGVSPASAIAAAEASTVSSAGGMPVLRPVREIPMPEMIASRSNTSAIRCTLLLAG
jgi:hypothetical protein